MYKVVIRIDDGCPVEVKFVDAISLIVENDNIVVFLSREGPVFTINSNYLVCAYRTDSIFNEAFISNSTRNA